MSWRDRKVVLRRRDRRGRPDYRHTMSGGVQHLYAHPATDRDGSEENPRRAPDGLQIVDEPQALDTGVLRHTLSRAGMADDQEERAGDGTEYPRPQSEYPRERIGVRGPAAIADEQRDWLAQGCGTLRRRQDQVKSSAPSRNGGAQLVDLVVAEKGQIRRGKDTPDLVAARSPSLREIRGTQRPAAPSHNGGLEHVNQDDEPVAWRDSVGLQRRLSHVRR